MQEISALCSQTTSDVKEYDKICRLKEKEISFRNISRACIERYDKISFYQNQLLLNKELKKFRQSAERNHEQIILQLHSTSGPEWLSSQRFNDFSIIDDICHFQPTGRFRLLQESVQACQLVLSSVQHQSILKHIALTPSIVNLTLKNVGLKDRHAMKLLETGKQCCFKNVRLNNNLITCKGGRKIVRICLCYFKSIKLLDLAGNFHSGHYWHKELKVTQGSAVSNFLRV